MEGQHCLSFSGRVGILIFPCDQDLFPLIIAAEALKKFESRRVIVKDCHTAVFSFSFFFPFPKHTHHLIIVYLAVAVMVGTLPLI